MKPLEQQLENGLVVKVSTNDPDAGTLEEKIAAGPGIILQTITSGSSEVLILSASSTSSGGPGSDTTAIHTDTASEIYFIAQKNELNRGDIVVIEDAEASYAKRHATIEDVLTTNWSGSLSSSIIIDNDFSTTALVGTWTALVSASITTTGEKVLVTGHQTIGAPSTSGTGNIRLRRNDDTIMFRQWECDSGGNWRHGSAMFIDEPIAGTHTYYLEAQETAGTQESRYSKQISLMPLKFNVGIPTVSVATLSSASADVSVTGTVDWTPILSATITTTGGDVLVTTAGDMYSTNDDIDFRVSRDDTEVFLLPLRAQTTSRRSMCAAFVDTNITASTYTYKFEAKLTAGTEVLVDNTRQLGLVELKAGGTTFDVLSVVTSSVEAALPLDNNIAVLPVTSSGGHLLLLGGCSLRGITSLAYGASRFVNIPNWASNVASNVGYPSTDDTENAFIPWVTQATGSFQLEYFGDEGSQLEAIGTRWLQVINFGSIVNKNPLVHTNVPNEFTVITEKTSSNPNDVLLIEDSENGFNKSQITIGTLLQGVQTGSSGGGTGSELSASYVLGIATSSLPNGLVLTAGPNITINTGSGFIWITGSVGGTVLANPVVENITASVSQSIFTLAAAPQNSVVFMSVNGATQHNSIDYTVSGSTVTYAGYPIMEAGDEVQFSYFTEGNLTADVDWTDIGNTLYTTSSVIIGTSSVGDPGVALLVSGNMHVSGVLTVGTGTMHISDGVISASAGDLTFFDTNNPLGKTLTQLAAGGTTSGSGGSVGLASQQHDLTYNPILLYQFDHDLSDSSGNGYDLSTEVGTPRYTEIAGLPALYCDGLQVARPTRDAELADALTGSITIEAIVSLPYNGATQSIVSIGSQNADTTTNNTIFQLYLNTNRRLHFFWEYAGGTNVDLQGPLLSTHPVHIAVTRNVDGVSSAFYVNGELLTIATGSNPPGGSTDSSVRMFVGNNGLGAPTYGYVSSIKVIPTELTPSEIKAEYDRTLGPLYNASSTAITQVSDTTIVSGNLHVSGTLTVGTGSLHISENTISASQSNLTFFDISNPTGLTLSELALGGGASPSEGTTILTASVSDWSFASIVDRAHIRIDTDGSGSYDISGIDATGFSGGEIVTFTNVSQDNVTWKHENTGSTASNRIITNGADFPFGPNDNIQVLRDGTSQRWRLM